MQGNTPQTYNISDFIEWSQKKQLVLDPSFQRGAVWTASAKAFLIDTIIGGFPMPQIYLRTSIDPIAKSTKREVVDGQQRLRAILEFTDDKFKTMAKTGAYPGLLYSELPLEIQEQILSYQLTAVQLINASEADVLEVFARLNSYSVKVTAAELRHAKFSEPVKWAIWNTTRFWSVLWEHYKIVSVRESVRLKNTSTIAELFMFAENGLSDGGERPITAYYTSRIKQTEEYFVEFEEDISAIIDSILVTAEDALLGTTFSSSPNFLMLVHAVMFLEGVAPVGKSTKELAQFHNIGYDDTKLVNVIQSIGNAFENDDLDGTFGRFIAASRSSTQTAASRRIRTEVLLPLLAK